MTIESFKIIITLTRLSDGGEIMKQFTVELDDMVCKWLSHISEITGKSEEKIIADGIYNQVSALEEKMSAAFVYLDQ